MGAEQQGQRPDHYPGAVTISHGTAHDMANSQVEHSDIQSGARQPLGKSGSTLFAMFVSLVKVDIDHRVYRLTLAMVSGLFGNRRSQT